MQKIGCSCQKCRKIIFAYFKRCCFFSSVQYTIIVNKIQQEVIISALGIICCSTDAMYCIWGKDLFPNIDHN